MINYITLTILGLWIALVALKFFIYKKKVDYNFLVLFASLLGYGYFYFYGKLETDEFETYFLIIGGIFIFNLFAVNIKQFIKGDLTDFDYYDLEKDFNNLSLTSEILRKRFISTIELLNDGICFREADKTMFGTDRFIDLMNFETNEFNVSQLEEKIYKDDLLQYKTTIDKLSKRNPLYSITYRVIHKNSYLWIKEKGKKIYLEDSYTIISTIKGMDIKLFPETEIEILNSIPSYKSLYTEVQSLVRKKNPFHLMAFELANIPEINYKYGRDVGDLMMGEYLKKIGFTFIKDKLSLFRISGIRYVLIIKDEKKYEILKRALTGGGELLNLQMVFGGISQTIYPNIGISDFGYEDKTADDIIEESIKALDLSFKDKSHVNYFFYEKL